MGNNDYNWPAWANRLRAHVKSTHQPWGSIAEKLKVSEGTVRHWCNGHREINLRDFFRLCEAAAADPRQILFGAPSLTTDDVRKLSEKFAELLVGGVDNTPNLTADYSSRQRALHSPAHRPRAGPTYKIKPRQKP